MNDMKHEICPECLGSKEIKRLAFSKVTVVDHDSPRPYGFMHFLTFKTTPCTFCEGEGVIHWRRWRKADEIARQGGDGHV